MGKKTRGERPGAWGAGAGCKVLLRDQCKICNLDTGTHVARRKGRSRHDSGNPRNALYRAPGCEGKDVRYWARNCPKRQLVEREMRRRF